MNNSNVHLTKVMIRFSEIAIKGSKTRKWLTDILIKHIKYVLSLKGIEDFEVINEYSRLFIHSEESEKVNSTISSLVPSVASSSVVYRSPTEIKDIKNIINSEFLKKIRENSSFAVRVKRTGKHSFTSMELASLLGEYILDKTTDIPLKVNLTNPDYTIYLDVRDDSTYLFDCVVKGIGGLPVGCQGNILVAINGEEEDIANLIQIYKRGANTIIYSLVEKEKLSQIYIKKVKRIIEIQPDLKGKDDVLIFSKEGFERNGFLDFYDQQNCKGISLSNAISDKYAPQIPVSIPLFVPHLVDKINEEEIKRFFLNCD